MKIALLYICTGKYSIFWENFYTSCEQNFLTEHTKEYYVFTDQDINPQNSRVNIVFQEKLGWPFDTLLRNHMFYAQYEQLKYMDYIFFCNANLIFLQHIEDDILPNVEGMVGLIHPGYYNKPRISFTYESNPDSLAYISPNEGDHYFMGSFYGGKAIDFLDMTGILAENIENDLENNIIAIWHDESHLNRYFINNPPKMLPPEYGYPEDWYIPFEKKILILDKTKFGGHDYLREIS